METYSYVNANYMSTGFCFIIIKQNTTRMGGNRFPRSHIYIVLKVDELAILIGFFENGSCLNWKNNHKWYIFIVKTHISINYIVLYVFSFRTVFREM